MNRYKGIADSGQREYITSHLNESMFVEAGAGAGKTTLIIERIVAQLVAGVKPEEIAASCRGKKKVCKQQEADVCLT